MKKVRFNDCITTHYMIAWDFAYKRCRQKYWEYIAVDRFRFQRRIKIFERTYNDRRLPTKHILQP